MENVKITNKNKADYVKLFDYFCKKVVLYNHLRNIYKEETGISNKKQLPGTAYVIGGSGGLLCLVVRKSSNHTFRVSPLAASQDSVW